MEIKINDLVERITTIKGSNIKPSRQIIIFDKDLLSAMERAKQYPDLFGNLHFEYVKVWRFDGKDYKLIYDKELEDDSISR